jgi:predicted porin
MFKKTLIAMSLAAVTGSAMADVSVSGRVEQTFTDTDGNTTGLVGSTDNHIVFSASEDLGNGMSAFAKVMLDTDGQDGASKDEIVGLKGSFGTVFVGRFEAFVEGKVASTMSLNGHAAIEQSTTNADRTSQGVAYVTPTVNGLHAGIGGYATGSESEDWDATEIAVFYSNGPLNIGVAVQDLNPTLAGATLAEKTTAISASYTMGDAKVSYLRMDGDDIATAADDRTDSSYRLDYTMGANKITVAHLDDETTNGAAGADVTALELTHSFSKRTQAYVGMTDSDTANADTTYFGMQHSF